MGRDWSCRNSSSSSCLSTIVVVVRRFINAWRRRQKFLYRGRSTFRGEAGSPLHTMIMPLAEHNQKIERKHAKRKLTFNDFPQQQQQQQAMMNYQITKTSYQQRQDGQPPFNNLIKRTLHHRVVMNVCNLNVCQMKFTHNSGLKQHQVIHTRERKFNWHAILPANITCQKTLLN